MSKIKAKQIERFQSAYIRIEAFNAAGIDDVVTTPLTSALATAGQGGQSVPLQASTSETTVGVITTGAYNRVEIYDSTTKDKLADALGNEVYGRITHSGGVYTLTYYSLVSGTETSYTFGSATDIDFEFVYRFDFHRFPTEGGIGVGSRNVAQDPAGSGEDIFEEQVTVTALNTLNDLTKTPANTTCVILFVNGVAYAPVGGSPPFSIAGKVLTWSSVNAGFSVETTDRVVAHYPTFE